MLPGQRLLLLGPVWLCFQLSCFLLFLQVCGKLAQARALGLLLVVSERLQHSRSQDEQELGGPGMMGNPKQMGSVPEYPSSSRFDLLHWDQLDPGVHSEAVIWV